MVMTFSLNEKLTNHSYYERVVHFFCFKSTILNFIECSKYREQNLTFKICCQKKLHAHCIYELITIIIWQSRCCCALAAHGLSVDFNNQKFLSKYFCRKKRKKTNFAPEVSLQQCVMQLELKSSGTKMAIKNNNENYQSRVCRSNVILHNCKLV